MTTDLTRVCKDVPAGTYVKVETALRNAGVHSLYPKFLAASFDDAIVTRCLNDDKEIYTISQLFPSNISFMTFKFFYTDQSHSLQTARPQGGKGHLSRSNTFQGRGHRPELKSTNREEKTELNVKKVGIAVPQCRSISVEPSQEKISILKMTGQEDDTESGNEPNSSTSEQEEPAPVACVKSPEMEDKFKVAPMEAKEATLLNISGQEDDGQIESNNTIALEGPVQIVELVCVEEEEREKMELLLQEAELRKIVSRVRDGRHVAVLTIAGKSHHEKSFLLSYIVAYLNFLQVSKDAPSASISSDWIEKCSSRMTGPLKEEYLWRSGSGTEKTGIRMWSKPFSLQSSDGSEFDLLLVDTQVVMDSFTSEEDFAMMVGLSLLTSSTLVFQTFNRLHENNLKTFLKCMDFGIMDIGLNNPKKEARPFKNLTFLISDWNSPSEYSFGASGGSELLNTTLGKKNTKNGEELRNKIKNSFEGLYGYLMPSSGLEETNVNSNGSAIEMSPEFVTHVKQFTENLLLQEAIQVETIAGNLVTGEKILQYFQNLVKAFNSDELPTFTTMTHDLTQVYNLSVLNNCKALYEADMERLFQEKQRIFVFQNDLDQIHEEAMFSALTRFDDSNKIGSQPAIQKLRDELIKNISNDVHENYLLRNNNTAGPAYESGYFQKNESGSISLGEKCIIFSRPERCKD